MLDDLERQGVDDETKFEVVRDVCGSTYRGEMSCHDVCSGLFAHFICSWSCNCKSRISGEITHPLI